MLIVQCDFDDTISVGNVGVAIRESFGDEEWRHIEEGYHAGLYGIEENNIKQFALVRATQTDIARFVETRVKTREGFEE